MRSCLLVAAGLLAILVSTGLSAQMPPPELPSAGTKVFSEGFMDSQVWIWGWSDQGEVLLTLWYLYSGGPRVQVWKPGQSQPLWEKEISYEAPLPDPLVQEAIREASVKFKIQPGAQVHPLPWKDPSGQTWTLKSGPWNPSPAPGQFRREFQLYIQKPGKVSSLVLDPPLEVAPGPLGLENFKVLPGVLVPHPRGKGLLILVPVQSPHMEFDWPTWSIFFLGTESPRKP